MSRKQFRSEDVIRDGKPNPCPECEKFKTCTKLCDKVERWASQDYVGRGDKTFLLDRPTLKEAGKIRNDFVDHAKFHIGLKIFPDKDIARYAWDVIEAMNLPKKSFEFAKIFYRDGKTLAQTAAILKLSSQAVVYRQRKLKRDVKNRIERIKIWEIIKDNYTNVTESDSEFIDVLFFGALWDMHKIIDHLGYTYKPVARRIKMIYDQKLLDKYI